MLKEEAIEYIKSLGSTGVISRDELIKAYNEGAGVETEEPKGPKKHLDVVKALYGIGAIIVVAGIIFLIAQMWDTFGAAAQILVTLGSAIAIYVAAVLFRSKKKLHMVSEVFFVISAVVMPVGIFVVLHHLSSSSNAWLGQLIMSVIPALVFFVTYRLFRGKSIFMVAILFATWALVAVIGLMLDSADVSNKFQSRVWGYVALILGIVYGWLGYAVKLINKERLSGAMFFLGALGGLGGGYALTFMHDFWYFLYFLLILAAIYLSTFLRSRSLLLFGALALVAHLTHINFEFFADSLGWPLMLIISGFVIIGVAFGTVALNKKFLSKRKA